MIHYIKQCLAQYYLNQLYKNIQSFHLAKQAREEQQLFSYEYIYGEINFASFMQLLKWCEIKPQSVFYDLGSGAGKAVMCAALMFDFKKICGIEQLKLLHDCAITIQQSSKYLRDKPIDWYHGDLLNIDWSDADVVFINASAFIGEFWQQVQKKLLSLKEGARIILVSKKLPEDNFELFITQDWGCSWGIARVTIYRRIRFMEEPST